MIAYDSPLSAVGINANNVIKNSKEERTGAI